MNKTDAFFEELSVIQNEIVNVMLIRETEYDNTRDILIDTTYEAIYRVLEILDGYGSRKVKYDILEKQDGVAIKLENLHDKCENYLMSTDM